jgi:hypothetical protein
MRRSFLYVRERYGSVKNGFDSAISNEDTKDEERKEGLGCWQTAKCGAKRQAHTCPGATPQTEH